jgi:hypothetical protein
MKMNTVSTKTNATAIPARAHPDTTRHVAVFSLSPRPSPLAGTMQLENWLALTLSLSPRRGSLLRPRWDESLVGQIIRRARELPPLPGAADEVSAQDKNLLGRGEGERLIPLHRSGMGRGRNLRRLWAISTHSAIRLVLSANQPDAVTARCASELPTRADSRSLSMREKVPTPASQPISCRSLSSYAARRAQLSLRSTALSTASWPRRAIGRSE